MTCQSTDDSHISFAKRLAHNNKQIREQTLKKLKRWLISTSKRGTLTEDGLLKIFKGLYYSMWYSDKPLLQENLAAEIASVLGSLPDRSHSVQYFAAFCETISREWTGIDRLRLDKFYMFFKTFLKHSITFCATCDWNEDVVGGIVGALDSKIVNINCTCPDSVAVFVAENLYTICEEVNGGLPARVMFQFLLPYVNLLAVTPKRDITRILLTHLFNPLCDNDNVISVDKGALSEYVFTLARGKTILTRNRMVLYSLKTRLGDVGVSNKEHVSGKRKIGEMEKENCLSENISEVSDGVLKENDEMKDNDGMKDNDNEEMKVGEACKVEPQCLSEKLLDLDVSDLPIDNVEESCTSETALVTSNLLHVTTVLPPSQSSDIVEDSVEVLFAETIELPKPKTKTLKSKKKKVITGCEEVENPEQDTIPELTQPQTVAEERQTNPEIECTPAQTINPESVAPEKELVLSKMVISAEESLKVSRKMTKTRKKKSASVSEAVPKPKSEVTPQPAKKKVRLSVENNTYSVFKKNSSLESPTPFDSTKTPVRSAIRRSSRMSSAQKKKVSLESTPKKTTRRKSVLR